LVDIRNGFGTLQTKAETIGVFLICSSSEGVRKIFYIESERLAEFNVKKC